MIHEIVRFLTEIDADQISFRKVGNGYGAHLNIQVQKLNDFNQSGYAMIPDNLLNDLMTKRADGELIDDMAFDVLKNNYNYGMNDKSAFYEECCPNCGAVTGEYEVTTMGGTPDRNKRTCHRCWCSWYSEEWTAELVTAYIKKELIADREKKDNPLTEEEFNSGADRI